MQDVPPMDEVEGRLVAWAHRREAIRAVLLTSTRAIPGGEVDVFSDYDAVLVVRDVHPFAADRRWIADFGEVLVAYWDPIQGEPDYGLDCLGNVTWYIDRPRIDFTVWPVALLERIVATAALPAELDAGYRVLLDKDGLAARLPAPTYAAYVPSPPDEAAYLATVNDFFVDVPAVAVGLLRDDLLPARWVLDCDMTHVYLLRMLQWRMECDRGWSMPARALGKGLRKGLPADVWDELRGIYGGASTADTWEALFRTVALFRRVARDVGDRLGYAYPDGLDERVTGYVRRLRDAPGDRGVAAASEDSSQPATSL